MSSINGLIKAAMLVGVALDKKTKFIALIARQHIKNGKSTVQFVEAMAFPTSG